MGSTMDEEPRKRRTFTDEFKQDAVRLVTTSGYTFAAAAKSLGIGEQSLRQWHAKLAPPPTPCGEDASVAALKAENQRLRRELRRAEMEREILKKPRPAEGGCTAPVGLSRRSRREIRLDS